MNSKLFSSFGLIFSIIYLIFAIGSMLINNKWYDYLNVFVTTMLIIYFYSELKKKNSNLNFCNRVIFKYILKQFKVNQDPVANKESIIKGKKFRFTILTESLL